MYDNLLEYRGRFLHIKLKEGDPNEKGEERNEKSQKSDYSSSRIWDTFPYQLQKQCQRK